jgi:hypothetical protein
MDLSWKAMRKTIDRDLLLDRLGLERQTPASDLAATLGVFSLGVLLGAALGLAFAPRRGEEIRTAVSEAWRNRGRREPDYGRDLGAEGGVHPTREH